MRLEKFKISTLTAYVPIKIQDHSTRYSSNSAILLTSGSKKDGDGGRPEFGFCRKNLDSNALHPEWLLPATLVTKLRLACARFGGQRVGLVLH